MTHLDPTPTRRPAALLQTFLLMALLGCGGGDGAEAPETTGAAPEGQAEAPEGQAEAPEGQPEAPEAPAPEPQPEPAPPAPHPEPHLVNLLRIPGALLATSSALHGDENQIRRLIDNDLETAWNSETGDIENAWIAFRVPEGAQVQRIEMTAGNTSDRGHRHYFTGNHRVRHVRVLHNGRPLRSQRLNFRDRGMQTIAVEGGPGEYQILLDELVPGRHHAWREATVSELRVLGTAPEGVEEVAAPVVVPPEGQEPTIGEVPAVASGYIPEGRDEIWGLGAPLELLPREYLLERIGAERRHRSERPDPPDFTAEIGPDYHDERGWDLRSAHYDGLIEALQQELMDRTCRVPAPVMRHYRTAYSRWDRARLRLLRLIHRREHVAHRIHDPNTPLPEGRAGERMHDHDERELHRIEAVDERITRAQEHYDTTVTQRGERLDQARSHSCPRFEGVLRDL